MNGGGYAAAAINQWKRLRRSENRGDRVGDASRGTRDTSGVGLNPSSRRVTMVPGLAVNLSIPASLGDGARSAGFAATWRSSGSEYLTPLRWLP